MKYKHAPMMLLLTVIMAATAAPSVQADVSESRSVDFWVMDQADKPVADAVVEVRGAVPSPQNAARATNFEMAQEGQQFSPRVLVVPVNAEIGFPNRDRVSHHVYSFSPAKQFELALYKGDFHEALTFDQAGIVSIGCNIHDKMTAHIVVTDAPWYGTTDQTGLLQLELPDQQVQVSVWHPRLIGQPNAAVALVPEQEHQFRIKVRPEVRVRRGLGSLTRSSK